MLDLPTIGIVIGSAAIDSINPCAIGVLILMMSVILGQGWGSKKLLLNGLTFIGAFFVTYLVFGLGLAYTFTSIPLLVAEYLALFVATLAILAALVEIKDYFWYGKGFSLQIPTRFAHKIHDYSTTKTSLWGIMFLGAFVAAVELPCTGASYLATIAILRTDFNVAALLLMVIYNLIFIAPLLIILIMVAGGANISSVSRWKEEHKGTMRLCIGLLLAALGWILILMANGTINFG